MSYAIKFRKNEESDLPTLGETLSRNPGSLTINSRSTYHYLINIDEFPELLPLAYHICTINTNSLEDSPSILPASHNNKKDGAISFTELVDFLSTFSKSLGHDDLTQFTTHQNSSQFLAKQLAPTMLISGYWLQNFSRAATAHTTVAGKLNKLFSLQTMAYAASGSETQNGIGSTLINLLSTFHESRQTKEISRDKIIEDFSFDFPSLLLSYGLFPREYLPELLGINLAWHYLGIHSFIEKTVLEDFLGSHLSHNLQETLKQRDSVMAALSIEAIEMFCHEQDVADLLSVQRRILSGIELLAAAWTKWMKNIRGFLSTQNSTSQSEMLKLIQSKGPHALGYHRDKRLGQHKIDALLDIKQFNPAIVLDALAESRYIVPGFAENSRFITELTVLGGPMAGVFSEAELSVIRSWINGLDSKDKKDKVEKFLSSSSEYPLWEKREFLKDCEQEYANRPCSLRELYYKLVNIEYFPDILPVAERFLIERLTHSRNTLTSGERPLPSIHYSHDVLEQWVFNKHRQQIDAYQPLKGKPAVSKEAFIQSTTSLAPLLLIDGGWLQGATQLNTLFTPVGLKLYRIFFEEIGEGTAEHHHSNIYRELLESMGILLPDITDLDFAFSEKFQDSAFEVPILWLSLSCFTRHYFPELLGMNLAVELAGLGASYMEAHDTLKYYGFPTTFVDYHNSTDNASVGHAALSMNTIKLYMNEVAEREGPHNLDAYWYRIWSGMRLTLPITSDYYWNPGSLPVSMGNTPYAGQTAIFHIDEK